MPYLSGKVVYSLRNSILHQGTPNITDGRMKNGNNKIDCFELILESKKSFDIYCDSSGIYNSIVNTYSVNIRRLCLLLCLSARAYYELNRDKFDFFHCSIIEWNSDADKKQI
jgi:hypothetical protein